MNVDDMMSCSCRDCTNRYYLHIDLVERHLYLNGIDLTYTQWIFHGGADPCRVNVTANLHTDTNSRIEEIDEVEELLGNVCMGTLLNANIGESSTTQGPTTDDHEHRTPFGH